MSVMFEKRISRLNLIQGEANLGGRYQGDGRRSGLVFQQQRR